MTLLVHTLHVLSLIQHTWLTNTNTGADTGIATGAESYIQSVVSSKKGVLTACAFLLNDFLLKRAPEGDRSGAISQSLVCCCCCKLSLKYVIFVHRISLRLAIRPTPEEAGERVAM